MSRCLRTVLWRNEKFLMYEYCSLVDTGEGVSFDGVVVAAVDGKPLRAAYQIACGPDGQTRSVVVDAGGGLGEHHLRLEADGQRVWRLNGVELPDCRGCIDVDLGFSPSTNTLPIRRLNLKPGESQTITTAWVRFPEFDVVPFPQRYTRLGQNEYRFESLISDFQAILVVDDLGIVQKYGEFWEAAAAGQEC